MPVSARRRSCLLSLLLFSVCDKINRLQNRSGKQPPDVMGTGRRDRMRRKKLTQRGVFQEKKAAVYCKTGRCLRLCTGI